MNKPEEKTAEKLNFEFIVKRDEKVIYQNKAHAGVVCVVEKIIDIDEEGQIVGQTQKFTFGNAMMIWFAFDQLRIAIEAKSMEILASIKEAIEARKFVNPDVKRKIIEATNILNK